MNIGHGRRIGAGVGAVLATMAGTMWLSAGPVEAAATELWAEIHPAAVTVDVGEPVDFTFTIGNRGASDAIEPGYRLFLDRWLEVVELPDGCERTDDGTGNHQSYECRVDSLTAGTQVSSVGTVRLTRVAETILAINAIDLATGDESIEFVAARISAATTSDLYAVPPPPVTVAGDFDRVVNPSPFQASVTVGNAGPRDAGEIIVYFVFDESNDDLSVVLTGPRAAEACERAEGSDEGPPAIVECTLPSLAASQTATLTVPLYATAFGTLELPFGVRLAGEDEIEAPEDRVNNDAVLVINTVRSLPPTTTPPPGLPVTGTAGFAAIVATGLALAGGGAFLLLAFGRRRGGISR